MKQLQTLIDIATKRNKKFEVTGVCSNVKTREVFNTIEFGVQISNWVWYWWKNDCIYSTENLDRELMFYHSYSMNTGKRHKDSNARNVAMNFEYSEV